MAERCFCVCKEYVETGRTEKADRKPGVFRNTDMR